MQGERTRERDVGFERVNERVARITIPLAFFSVPVNVHVVLAERPLLVDVGPRTDEALERLGAGLDRLSLRLEDVADAVVTHHHVDHGGFLSSLVERSRARAWVHEDDLAQTLDVPGEIRRRAARYREVARLWGLSHEDVAGLARNYEGYAVYGGTTPRERLTPVKDGELLAIPGIRLRAIHVPGHSEGQIVLHDEDANALFAADCVLERVTPNPTVYIPPYRGRTTGLGDSLASLERLRSLPRDVLVLPGHGAPFRGLHARLDEIRSHHEERARGILALLAERKEATVVSLAREIWRGLRSEAVVLAAREVHGHLDILEQQGSVAREERDGAWMFRRAT
ncbi:MBL fold metallo-hydrolase [bacterium]|nr:MBL fold metallo-hydrolase [bacterium]